MNSHLGSNWRDKYYSDCRDSSYQVALLSSASVSQGGGCTSVDNNNSDQVMAIKLLIDHAMAMKLLIDHCMPYHAMAMKLLIDRTTQKLRFDAAV